MSSKNIKMRLQPRLIVQLHNSSDRQAEFEREEAPPIITSYSYGLVKLSVYKYCAVDASDAYSLTTKNGSSTAISLRHENAVDVEISKRQSGYV